MRELVELVGRVAELERRFASMMRHGTVEEVDAAKQLVRLRIGEPSDAPAFLGPWVPYAQIAGALKLHSPPSKGQQMTLLSPTGDFRQAVALPFTWSDQNKSPSDKPDEHVLTFGSFTFTLKGEELTIKGNKVVFDVAEFRTTGQTVLANGAVPTVFKGSSDSAGDINIEGTPQVLIPVG